MCGIFGWSFGNKAAAITTPMQRMLLVGALATANESRGDKSWGIYASRKGASIMDKGVGPISQARNLHKLARYPEGFGHTRWPTTGDVTKENAHPFYYKGITMAHNGVIYNHWRLNQELEPDQKCKVDSEHLLRALAGERKFEEIEGYGTIEWAEEADPGKLYLCRMEGGSLTVRGLWIDDTPVATFWSSDDDHMRHACDVAGLDSRKFVIEDEEVYAVYGGRLWETGRPKIKIQEGKTFRHWSTYGSEGSTLSEYGEGDPLLSICLDCGETLTSMGWCKSCKEVKTKTVTREARIDRSQAFEKRLNDLADTLELSPHGAEDWKDALGEVVTRSELIDLLKTQDSTWPGWDREEKRNKLPPLPPETKPLQLEASNKGEVLYLPILCPKCHVRSMGGRLHLEGCEDAPKSNEVQS